jgi:hypothetical protein
MDNNGSVGTKNLAVERPFIFHSPASAARRNTGTPSPQGGSSLDTAQSIVWPDGDGNGRETKDKICCAKS